MLARIRNSWGLVKASAGVLRADKELIVFPIVSAIALLIVSVSFAVPMFLTGLLDSLLEGQAQILGVIVGFLFYLVQYFVIIFANTALVGAAMIRLEGGDPTLGDGFRIALRRIVPIMGYALISATVGMILRWIAERGGTIGRFISSLLGLGWNLATYLVVPVLVVEEVGPIEAIKRSAGLLKKTWGEQIVGNLSIGLIFGLVIALVIVLGIAAAYLAVMTESTMIIVAVVAFFIATVVLIGLINSTLDGIYTAAVYRYAAKGEAGGFFDEDLVKEAFRLKG